MSEELDNMIQNKVEEIKEKNNDIKAISSLSPSESEAKSITEFKLLIISDNVEKKERKEREGKKLKLIYNSKQRILENLKEDDWYNTYRLLKHSRVRYDPENVLKSIKEQAQTHKQLKMEINDEKQQKIYEKIETRKEKLDTQDVGQKRYLMYDLFDFMLLQNYYLNQEIPVPREDRLKKLKTFDGYFYKLSQEFLTASSTAKKARKIEKMANHIFNQLSLEKKNT